MKKMSRKKIGDMFGIPYPTINDWSTAESGNWRFKILNFLSNMTEEEIKTIKKRDKENINTMNTSSIKKDIEQLSNLKDNKKSDFIKSCSKEQIANLSATYIIGRRGWDNSVASDGITLSDKEKAVILKNDFLDEKKDLEDEDELFLRKEWLSGKGDLSEKLKKGLSMIEEVKNIN